MPQPQFTTSKDRNGNKTCRVTLKGQRGFSIQTLGELPRTHREGCGPWTQGEVSNYVKRFGTQRQRDILGF